MKKKHLFLLMAAATLWTACSNNNDPEGPATGQDNEIRLKTTVSQISAGTRAAFATTTLADNPLTALVLANDAADFKTMRCEGTMTFDNDAEVAYNKPIWNGKFEYEGTDPVYLVGLYPAGTNASGWTRDYDDATAVFIFDGSHDVMVASQVEDKVVDDARKYGTLAFAHQLTWIKIKITGNEAAAAAAGKAITVTGIKLTQVDEGDVANTATVNLAEADAANAVTLSGNTPLDIWEYNTNYSVADVLYGTNEEVVAEYTGSNPATEVIGDDDTYPILAHVLAPPSADTTLNGSVYNYTFEVSYEEGGVASTQTVRVALNGTITGSSLASHYVNLHLHFSGSQIKALATVGAWEEGPSHTQPI